jgi:hypothetical protein
MWRPILPSVAHDVAGLVEAQRRRALGVGQVGAGQVGRAAQHLGQGGGEGFQRDLRGLARGHGLGLGVGAMAASTATWAKFFGSSPFMRRTNSAASSGCAAR